MIINHNMSALFAERQLNVNGLALDKSLEKLSSGSRITRAGDDASGLAVSEKLRSQIRGLARRAPTRRTGSPSSRPRKAISRRARTSSSACGSFRSVRERHLHR